MQLFRSLLGDKRTSDTSFAPNDLSEATAQLQSYPDWFDLEERVQCQKVHDKDVWKCKLKLAPIVPERIPSGNIHKVFSKGFGSEYDTCYRVSGDVFMQTATSASAVRLRGKSVTIEGASYTLEFTAFHSTMYVCDDVQGATTSQLIKAMDRPPLATEYGIGLVRQQNNGPVAAFTFDPPMEDCLEFTLKVDGKLFKFKPAQSKCCLCEARHESYPWECDQLVIEKRIAPPGGYLPGFEKELSHLQLRFVSVKDSEVGASIYPGDGMYNSLVTWNQMKDDLAAARANNEHKYLGQSREK